MGTQCNIPAKYILQYSTVSSSNTMAVSKKAPGKAVKSSMSQSGAKNALSQKAKRTKREIKEHEDQLHALHPQKQLHTGLPHEVQRPSGRQPADEPPDGQRGRKSHRAEALSGPPAVQVSHHRQATDDRDQDRHARGAVQTRHCGRHEELRQADCFVLNNIMCDLSSFIFFIK